MILASNYEKLIAPYPSTDAQICDTSVREVHDSSRTFYMKVHFHVVYAVTKKILFPQKITRKTIAFPMTLK